MTTQGTESITIQAAPEAVWPWIADLSKHPAWSPKPYKVDLVSGEPGAVGARYRSVGVIPGDKDHANDVEITEVIPGQRFVLVASDSNGPHQNIYTLRAVGTGTEVTHQLIFPEMKGVSKVLLPVLFPLVGKSDMRKRLGLLKTAIETQPGPA
jgi:uncharacterized protein YndB with AHSA1/START domain